MARLRILTSTIVSSPAVSLKAKKRIGIVFLPAARPPGRECAPLWLYKARCARIAENRFGRDAASTLFLAGAPTCRQKPSCLSLLARELQMTAQETAMGQAGDAPLFLRDLWYV